MSAHRCHAQACETEAVPELPFCLPHWQRCPARLQFDLWRFWRPIPAPTEAARDTLQAAIAAVAAPKGAP